VLIEQNLVRHLETDCSCPHLTVLE
jgi:alkylation response protein AidB-like acyl-CoA dehydrogenase